MVLFILSFHYFSVSNVSFLLASLCLLWSYVESSECLKLIYLLSVINCPSFDLFWCWSWTLQIKIFLFWLPLCSVQFSSVTQSCLTLCDPIDCSTPGLPVSHQLPDPDRTHVHWVGDAIQPSHPLSSPPPPAFNLSQHQDLLQWVSSSHQVVKVLQFQLQH